MSTKEPLIYTKLADVAAALSKIGIAKNDTNTFDNYQFRGIDALYNSLSPILAEHRVVILPVVKSRESVSRASKSGGELIHSTVEVDYRIVAEDGSHVEIRAYGEAMDRGDKSLNKAFTAAYKYAMFQAFCIPIRGMMDDADSESHEVAVEPNPVEMIQVPKERQAVVRAVADACIQKHGADDDWGVYEEACSITDTQEKLLLWNYLKPHSKVRATIKRMAEQERAAA